MGNTYYIAAIELSSSKISGAVGIETHEGIRILATASTPVNGFITKGVVRNVDETSNAINCIINNLEQTLEEKYKVSIKRAYISFAGLTVHSIKSKVTRGFADYTKITPDIINDMARENDDMFNAPEGYIRVRSITQEYKIDGKIDNNPVGAPTKTIEGNYLNLVIKEQYFKQLEECFTQAKIEIADSFSAARMDADIMLSKDARRNGCALVNIGADTTTIAIYKNDLLRMLTVLPLGSSNITRDICAEHVSYDEAEEIKITRGYNSPVNEKEPVETAVLNGIINARAGEILQNVKYRIEESGEDIHHLVFTGGGSKLKNFDMLLEEYLPNFKNDIVSEPQFNLVCDNGVNINGVFTTALYGLLKQGKDNCCEEEKPQAKPLPQQEIQTSLWNEIEEPQVVEPKAPVETAEDRRRKAEEEKQKRKEEERRLKEEKKKKKEEERKRREEERKNNPGMFATLFGTAKQWFEDATGDDENDNRNND